MRALWIPFLALLTSCATMNCEHYSGWCDPIRETAGDSWRFGQLSTNVYERGDSFEISNFAIKIEDYPNSTINFYASLFRLKDGKLALVYRGTDSLADFLTGNNPFLQMQNSYGLDVFDRAVKEHGMISVVAGHSLGGGIAMHVSLNRPDVTAFSFNGSPVFRKKSGEFENERYSIVEYGEILKAARVFGRSATQYYTSIGCTEDGGVIRQHSIRLLAECLTQIAATQSMEADASLRQNKIEREYVLPES